MKFLIVGDLHGNMPEFFFNDFDAIIAPGDFCSDDSRKYMFEALRQNLENPKNKVNWYDLVGRDKAKNMIEKSLKDGRKILSHLNSFNVPVYLVPGNWDWTADEENEWDYLQRDHFKSLIKGLNNIVDLHEKSFEIEDFNFIGYGISSGPEYPQYKEDLEKFSKKKLDLMRIKYVETFNKIDHLFNESKKPVIFLSHNVPFNTSLDKIENENSPRNGCHFGSLVTREIIDKHQPLLCIGGHMHEHFGKDKLKNTTLINAGFGSYVNVLLELDENRIKNIEFFKN